MAQIDEKQRRTAEWLADQVAKTDANRYALWNLWGSVGSGKSSVLRLVANSLRGQGLVPIIVAAPGGEVDSAPIALLSTASQLESANLLNGEIAKLADPRRRWTEKLELLTRAVERHFDRVVLLCDEPARWYRSSESALYDTPDRCARSYADWIVNETNCRRVVTGWVSGFVPYDQRTPAPRLDDGRAFLAEDGKWGAAGEIAALLRQSLSQPMLDRSIWGVKLCVALCRFKSLDDVVAGMSFDRPADVLLDELLDLLERDTSHRLLCEALAQLAIPRTALPRVLFLEMTEELDSLDRDLISFCLVDWHGDRFALHPLVRDAVVGRTKDPRRWESDHPWRLRNAEREAWHRRLKAEYPLQIDTTLRDQLESLHHDLLGGNPNFADADARLHFVEQLHEIGRTLSYVHRHHERAAELFRIALRFDADHSYSHHYLAFNLDWLARNSEEIETHYQEAIRLQPDHPWWWSRWISYLATRGRFQDARQAWREAMAEISVSETGSSPEWLCRSLHRWVARWLLHWGELDFAEEVLRSVPREVARTDTSIQALGELLAALREAQSETAVFPLSVPAKERWSSGPHTNLPLRSHDKQLLSWQPARVECVESAEEMVFLLAARRPESRDSEPEYERLELTRNEVESIAYDFEWRDLGEGRFVEFGYYGPDNLRKMGLHRVVEWRDPRLLPLVPPPDRWYRRAVAAAWASKVEAD